MRTGIHSKSPFSLTLLLLAALFIASSCTQDSVNEGHTEDLNVLEAKSSNATQATRAIRGKLNNAPNPDIPVVVCDPVLEPPVALTTNFIYGNMTHLGKIQPGSFGRPIECELDLELGVIVSVYEVNYIGAHGDEIRTRENVTIIPDDPTFATGTFEGTIEIIGGTGRFENATGSMEFVDAIFVGPNSTWELVGEITY